MKYEMPAINVQFPISRLIIDSDKIIETRIYKIPEKYLNKEMAIVETPASGVRRNPVVAALSWPLVAFGIWRVAERFIVDQETGSVVVGFALQAGLLLVPFFLLERAADAVGARRMSVRIAYLCGVLLLVGMQVLGGMTTLEDSADSDVGRVLWFLALAALLQLLSTLAVTEMCRSIDVATGRDADAHNALIDSRQPTSRQLDDAESLRPLGVT